MTTEWHKSTTTFPPDHNFYWASYNGAPSRLTVRKVEENKRQWAITHDDEYETWLSNECAVTWRSGPFKTLKSAKATYLVLVAAGLDKE